MSAWTCLCSSYVIVANIGVLIFGLALEAFALYVVLADPLRSFDFDEVKDLWNAGQAKIGLIVCGILVSLAGCMGLHFARRRNRITGGIYMILLMVAFAIQVVLIAGLFAESSQMAKLNNLTNRYMNATLDEQRMMENQEAARQQVMAKSFKSFAKRFASPDYQCSIQEAGGVTVTRTSTTTTTATQASARVAATEYRAIAYEEVDFARELASVDDRCYAGERRVECLKNPKLAAYATDYCRAKPGKEDDFTLYCGACVQTYFDAWNVSKGLKPEDEEYYRAKFEGQEGTAYCRCLTRFFDTAERHAKTIAQVGVAFASLQLVLMMSVCWLILCGPEETPRESDERQEMVEMNLGPQYVAPSAPVYAQQSAIQVMCPYDAGPGTAVMVTAPDGRQVQVLVPANVGPGMYFQVLL